MGQDHRVVPGRGERSAKGRGFFHSLGRNKPSENHQTNGRYRRMPLKKFDLK